MFANAIARIVRTWSNSEPALEEKLSHDGARAKLLVIAAFAPEIVTCHADLTSVRQHRLRPKKRITLGALYVHFQERDVLESLLLADVVERSNSDLDRLRLSEQILNYIGNTARLVRHYIYDPRRFRVHRSIRTFLAI
jgi:hypothetical protein